METKAVFFDAGETLVHPHPSFPELFAEVLRDHGHEVDPEMVRELAVGASQRFTETLRSDEHALWSTSADRSRRFWFSMYLGLLGDTGIEDPDGRLTDALYARFSDLESYRLHPDALPLLERLEAGGYPMGVISNFEEWLEGLLEKLAVTRFFPVRVVSGIEGVEKPDPAIFRIALDRMGVAAEESVYVGDHPYFDVEAAGEVGMRPVLIDRRGLYPEADGVRITSLEDLPEAVGLRV
ncbi:MAG TPA: HAD-IA family hydrolase [Actinomycetota bacterium]